MSERKYDQQQDKELNIITTGLIEWPHGVNMDYLRTESSSYADLDNLIEEYEPLENSHLVDFGSGKGRIVFYINHRFGMPATGIEVNGVAFSHLMQNYADYTTKFPSRKGDIRLQEVKAEEYSIRPEDNVFYFFNPFMINIFEEVVKNIEASIKEYPRVVDIILYYPSIGFGYFMDHETNFERVQKIKNIKYRFNNRECFDIFRYYPE